jgi:hypothetical protein
VKAICDKRDWAEFRQCLTTAFPVGSSYDDLDKYLQQSAFVRAKPSQSSEAYYRWSSGDIGNYKIAVFVRITPEGRIAEMEVR